MKFAHETREVVEIDGKFLVVYKWDGLTDKSCPRIWENVQLFDRQGKKLWTVNGMESCQFWNNDKDTFVGVRMGMGFLQLISFSGNSFDLDIATGKVSFSGFLK